MRRREIIGVENAEDIVLIPGSEWILTSAWSSGGIPRPRAFFINTRTHEMRQAWPEGFTVDLDRDRFGDVEPPESYSFHGLDIIQRGTVIEAYQVNHAPEHGSGGGRESVEVFEIDLMSNGPSLRWRGAVLGPSWLNGNDVCALPDGGFAITNFCYPGPEATKMGVSGDICGNVLEWRNREDGWRVVAGTDLNYPNGIALAPDAETYFVASWGLSKLVRVSRGMSPTSRIDIPLEGLVDNITWTPDGGLLCCVQLATVNELFVQAENWSFECPFQAVRVDPATLEAEVLVADHVPGYYATTAIEVRPKEVWVSSLTSDRILIYNY